MSLCSCCRAVRTVREKQWLMRKTTGEKGAKQESAFILLLTAHKTLIRARTQSVLASGIWVPVRGYSTFGAVLPELSVPCRQPNQDTANKARSR